MADRYPKERAFESIEQRINDAFSNLINQLKTRRDLLLREIRELKLDFQKQLESQQKTLSELENYKKQLQSMGDKTNITPNFVQLSLTPIDNQIKVLRNSQITPLEIHFSCQTANLTEVFQNLGKLDYGTKAIDYASKRKAKHIIGIPEVTYVHIDETHLYVGSGKRITRFHTNSWAFATTKDYCYAISSEVSNETNYKVNKFTKDKFQFMKQQDVTGGTNSKKCEFTSIAIASEDEIFVVDKANNRICVFDYDLFFRREFGMYTLKAPNFLIIQENRVIVRDDTKELRSFYKQCSQSLD